MKKVFSVVLATMLVAGLAGCSSRGETVEQEQPTNSEETHYIESDAPLVSDDMQNNTADTADDGYSDLEITAAEFCMAYMNHLKNPYSFVVKSIWAYDSPTGGYHVYVKFTAQNSFGADEVKEITNNVPITDSVLESISRTDEVLSSLTIYVSEGQNERNDGSHGEWLDTDRIQSYIDDNYV